MGRMACGRRVLLVVWLVWALPIGGAAQAQADGGAAGDGDARLPEGASGVASGYAGDAGIEEDERVVFVEAFEADDIDAVHARWEDVANGARMSLSDDVPAAGSDDDAGEDAGGGRSLLMTHTGGGPNTVGLYRRLPAGHDVLFARFYVKFDNDCAPIHHMGTHLGGFNPSTAWPQGGAGERPDGARRFTTGLEPYGDDWAWGFYSYWHAMRRHGDGNYWGTPFLVGVDRPEVRRGAWICVEMMVKLNALGERDGEQAFWIDGELWRADGQVVSHHGPGFPRGGWTGGWWAPDVDSQSTFEGFSWRTDEDLSINYLWTYLFITRAEPGQVSRVWFDQIVVATQYIGPMGDGAGGGD
ncbi:hypothetical protein OT109_07230 [Phycisphaeraceae bacterium D3-23]